MSKALLVLLSSSLPYHGALLGASVDPTPLSIDRVSLPRRMDFELALKMEIRERIWKMGNEDCSRHRNNGSRDTEMFLEKISKVNKNMGPPWPSGPAFKSQCCCALDVWHWASHLQTQTPQFSHWRMGRTVIVSVSDVVVRLKWYNAGKALGRVWNASKQHIREHATNIKSWGCYLTSPALYCLQAFFENFCIDVCMTVGC